MKTVISLASALALALSLDAQISVSTNRVSSVPGGGEEVRIRNDSARSLEAFAVYAKRVNYSGAVNDAAQVMFSDSMEPQTEPLRAGEELVVMARGPVAPGQHFFEEPIVTAGIFTDGTTTGDTALLTRLILRRSNMLLAVETSLETLSDAGRRNIPRDQLIEQFKKMANSVNHWYIPPEQQVASGLYRSIVGKLMDLPEGEAGSAFPPATFVERETLMLNRQRYALLGSQPSLADAAFPRLFCKVLHSPLLARVTILC
jgi:hypothetical protein